MGTIPDLLVAEELRDVDGDTEGCVGVVSSDVTDSGVSLTALKKTLGLYLGSDSSQTKTQIQKSLM